MVGSPTENSRVYFQVIFLGSNVRIQAFTVTRRKNFIDLSENYFQVIVFKRRLGAKWQLLFLKKHEKLHSSWMSFAAPQPLLVSVVHENM